MSQNDNHIRGEDEDSSRTVDAGKLLHEIGSRIGSYKLLRILGEGGFGIVYLAQQEHPIKRQVALKVIKPGMDTKQVIARFETERQALAMLDHPNIAQVFDAGATEAGRPYFAMEYVKGIPITEYCDKCKLGTQERLRLFIPLCHAIQHAHQKGIIHRDIKPSNALVMLQEDKPIPKIIDFGVAKALHQRLTEKTVVTEKGEFIGTPEYMSPEQAELTGLDVDTRTDIYSLGVLLYELLTGCTPFDPEDLRSKGYAQMQRIICEQDPVKPSTKLTTLGGKVEDIAMHRSVTAEQLRKSVRGDLDWIVMKCLEKDRARRYDTANGLATDLERHLSNEPVMARPPTRLYRFHKLVRRKKVVFDAAAAVMAVLCAVGVLAAWYFHRQAGIRWAREELVPTMERLITEGGRDNYVEAYKVATKARKYIPHDSRLSELLSKITVNISIKTEPPGAKVYLKEYQAPGDEWEYLGISPIENTQLPVGFFRWKMEKEGYETVFAAAATFEGDMKARSWIVGNDITRVLDKKGTVPPGMVRAKGAYGVGDFFIDKYEVTNRQFREFVNQGGYQKRDYWKQKFIKDGNEIPWEEAVREFVDATGKPGPATWRAGEIPNGQENHPVSGVSWYEAAAYAEFTGKNLPTAVHWGVAGKGGMSDGILRCGFYRRLVPKSNFGRDGPAPVGSYPGMTAYGTHDMAGNVREWCWNEAPKGRVIRGGAWNDEYYMFAPWSQASPFDRSPKNGFRCVLYIDPDKIPKSAFEVIKPREWPDFYKEPAVSDSEFEIYRNQFSYDKTDLLDAKVELRNETRQDCVPERITFNAAYGNERMIAYLFVPRRGSPPYQTVIYFPGALAFYEGPTKDLDTYYEFEDKLLPIIRSGRAVLLPVYKGTFERAADDLVSAPWDSYKHTEWIVKMVQDFKRSIDYLETRSDIDSKRLAYFGWSSGGTMGALLPAVEDRIAASVLGVGGFDVLELRAVSAVTYVSRVKIPTLMLNGKYDLGTPYETTVKPMFDLLGTPKDQKELKLYETDHWLPRDELVKETLAWLDRYLGPVK